MRVAQHGKGTGVSTMSDFDLDDWDEDEETDNGPGDLRKALKAAQRKLKAAEQALADQGKTIRKRTISDAIAAKGLNPKLAALVPPDLEGTEEAVSAWVSEFSDVFAPASAGTNDPAGGSEGSEGRVANQSFYTEEELAAQGIINRAQGGQAAAPGTKAATLDKLNGAESVEDILEIARGG